MSGALEKAFLEDIVANIDDDTPRLVYADWLTEHGKDDRAEFIRVQVELARLPSWDPACVRLRLREQALLKQHGAEWLAELKPAKGAKWEGFRRGIIAEVSFQHFEDLRASVHECRAVAPIEAASVYWPRRRESRKSVPPIAELRELVLHGRPYDKELPWLADSPQLSTLHTLSVLGLDPDDLARLASSPHLSRLRTLRLPSNGLGNAGVRALTEASAFTALEELDLSGPGYYEGYYQDPLITEDGLEALARWPGLATVRSLTLAGSNVRQAGLRALLNSPHVLALKELSLRSGRLDGQAMVAFGSALRQLRLEKLDLGANLLKEVGAKHVASAHCLSELKELRLDRCEIPLTGARSLAEKATFLAGLRVLDVGHNNFGPAGLEALLQHAPAALHTLQMRNNDLFDKGVTLLASSPASDTLLELDLSQNGLGPDAARALGASSHLRQLLLLYLGNNPISAPAAATLASSPLGKRLAVLEMKDVHARYQDEIPF
jgi:uncharacterized protein (TIGR02996 family)